TIGATLPASLGPGTTRLALAGNISIPRGAAAIHGCIGSAAPVQLTEAKNQPIPPSVAVAGPGPLKKPMRRAKGLSRNGCSKKVAERHQTNMFNSAVQTSLTARSNRSQLESS